MDTTQIQAFFFKAMVEGWATTGGGQKITIPQIPGYKAIDFTDGDFRLLDCYCVNSHSPVSAGTTTIWHQGNPVWMMSYGGFYTDSTIAFLKRVLLKTYEASQFVGGRGPRIYIESDLVYTNRVSGNFNHFSGREEILNAETGALLGFHEYSGIDLSKIPQ